MGGRRYLGDSTKSTNSVKFGFLALNLLVFGLLPQNVNIIEEKYVLKDSYTFCTIYFVKSSFISNILWFSRKIR